MNQSESNFIKLEQKLHQLLEAYKAIKEEKSSLKEEIEALKQSLKESRIETARKMNSVKNGINFLRGWIS